MQPWYSLNSQTPRSGRLDIEWQIERVASDLCEFGGYEYEDALKRARRIVINCRTAIRK